MARSLVHVSPPSGDDYATMGDKALPLVHKTPARGHKAETAGAAAEWKKQNARPAFLVRADRCQIILNCEQGAVVSSADFPYFCKLNLFFKDESMKKANSILNNDVCEVPRWQLLKQQLNNLSPKEFERAIRDTPDAVVIDVRTPAEFAAGHIEDAINIDYLSYDFWDRMEQLDPQRTYFIYCRTARRSVRTCTLMRNGGFQRVYHLEGGWNLWLEIMVEGGG